MIRRSIFPRARGAAITLGLAAATALGACSDDPTGPSGDAPPEEARFGVLEFHAEAASLEAGRRVQTHLRVTNRGEGRVDSHLPGGCLMWLRAYRVGRWDRPAWDVLRIEDIACTDDAVIVRLEPGQSMTAWDMSIPAAFILGDTLRGGEYQLAATLYPEADGPSLEILVGEPLTLER